MTPDELRIALADDIRELHELAQALHKESDTRVVEKKSMDWLDRFLRKWFSGVCGVLREPKFEAIPPVDPIPDFVFTTRLGDSRRSLPLDDALAIIELRKNYGHGDTYPALSKFSADSRVNF